MGYGTDQHQTITADNVPTIIACGKYDQYGYWDKFPGLVHKYESNDANHIALWMDETGHNLPVGKDPVLGIDRYGIVHTFFDQYLKPDQHPEVLYVLPKDGNNEVSLKGYSQSVPGASALPKNALNFVVAKQPITVHFGQPMNFNSVVNDGIQISRKSDKSVVSGKWSARRGYTVFQFIPDEDLLPRTTYQIIVRKSVENLKGKNVLVTTSTDFTTG